jgi:hypothetical protein
VGHVWTKAMNGYNQNFRFENGVLHVQLSGKFPNELLSKGENLFQPLIDACSTYNCKKALVDARELQVDFSTMAMFQAGEDVAFLTRAGLRIAMLVRGDMLDPFFATVATNRGGLASIFTDLDTTLDWLQK